MASLEVEVDNNSNDSDNNSSDADEYDDEGGHLEVGAKLEIWDSIYYQSDAIWADAYETDDEDEQSEGDQVGVKVEDDVEDDADVQMSDQGWSFNP